MADKDPNLMARCLECDSRIYFERKPDVGQIIVADVDGERVRALLSAEGPALADVIGKRYP